MKKAAFLDIDGTLHHGFTTVNFTYHLNEQKFFSNSQIKLFDKKNRDPKRYSDYPIWSHEADVEIKKLFTGHRKEILKKYLDEYENDIRNNLYHYSAALVNFLKEQGFEIILVTGSLDFVAEVFARILSISFSNVVAEELAEKDGKFLPEIKPFFGLFAGTKKKALLKFGEKYDLKVSIAFGDTENDLEMLKVPAKGFLMTDSKTPEVLKKEAKNSNLILIDKNNSLNQLLNMVKLNLP